METEIKESIAAGSFQEIPVENGFVILTGKNETDSKKIFTQAVRNDVIQFHFCVKGRLKFNFNAGGYSRDLNEGTAMLLYNPTKALPVNLAVTPQSWAVSLLISLEKFHRFFSKDASYIEFINEGNRSKKYYRESQFSPSIAVLLNQILHFNLHPSLKELYLKGKIYELISLYFNKSDELDVEQCPFLKDEANVRKIKDAKEMMINNMMDPPTLKELSEKIGLSLKKLKKGFKEVYGDTVYGFLFKYKMEYARKLLESGQYNVNEAGLHVGYSTASHFISAFKKKYGTTPKKYLQSVV